MLSFVVVYIELVLFVFWEGLVVKKNHYAAHFGSQTCNTLASTGITEVNTCLANRLHFLSYCLSILDQGMGCSLSQVLAFPLKQVILYSSCSHSMILQYWGGGDCS